MREVDNVHHTKDDDQAQGGKQKKCAIGRELIENADKRSETIHTRGSAPARSRDSGRATVWRPTARRAPPSCLRLSLLQEHLEIRILVRRVLLVLGMAD